MIDGTTASETGLATGALLTAVAAFAWAANRSVARPAVPLRALPLTP